MLRESPGLGEKLVDEATVFLGAHLTLGTLACLLMCKLSLLLLLGGFVIRRATKILRDLSEFLDSYDDLRDRKRTADQHDDGPGGHEAKDDADGGGTSTLQSLPNGGVIPEADDDEVVIELASRTGHVVVKVAASGLVSVFMSAMQHGPNLHL